MADNWFVGNAVAYGQGDNRGWLIGHFLGGPRLQLGDHV
jgi:hypothetical protein